MEKQSKGDRFVKQSVFLYSRGKNASSEHVLCERANNGTDVTDATSICTSCGQGTFTKKPTQSANLLQEPPPSGCNFNVLSMPSASPNLKQSKLHRSSSCQPKYATNSPFLEITKSSSNTDVDGQKEKLVKKIRLRRTGSKETSKSSLCLTQSWSLNLDTFRLVRNGSHNSNPCGSRYELSTKDSVFGPTITRNHCNEIKEFYVDKRSSEMFSDTGGSDSDTESIYEISTPKLKRELKFVNGHAFEEDSMKIPSAYGELKLKFQFVNETNKFRVTILKGLNIASQNVRRLGIYSKACLVPGKKFVKCGEDKHDTHDPVFYETFVFRIKLTDLLNRDLKIKVYNKPGIFSFSQPVGECVVHLYNHDLTSSTVLWQNLKKCRRQKVRILFFLLCLTYTRILQLNKLFLSYGAEPSLDFFISRFCFRSSVCLLSAPGVKTSSTILTLSKRLSTSLHYCSLV